MKIEGEQYSWRKRSEWLTFLDLPVRSGEPFTLAMDVDKVAGDRQLLAQYGWRVVDPLSVSHERQMKSR
jgi:hypothetical protein